MQKLQISRDEYYLWRDLIQKKSGIFIKENQIDFLNRRLLDRMQKLTIHSFAEYYTLIANESNWAEWLLFLETLVNPETSFFRHQPSFDALRKMVLPELFVSKKTHSDNMLYLWSAAASKGQEAYSLAITVAETAQALGHTDFNYTVFGTDISRNALSRAKLGEYSTYETRGLSQQQIGQYMELIGDSATSLLNQMSDNQTLLKHYPRYRIKDEIRRHVQFSSINFKSPQGFYLPRLDIIFCQNLFIYFEIHDCARTIEFLLHNLNIGGYLFLSPGENIGIKVTGADLVNFKDTAAYKRNKETLHVRVI